MGNIEIRRLKDKRHGVGISCNFSSVPGFKKKPFIALPEIPIPLRLKE
ncbi:hypothetical protein [Microaceticoccus formicicus]|nr:hypothetical protein VZL98_07830 [Peptoniphilaceae bacterium AMB_02]